MIVEAHGSAGRFVAVDIETGSRPQGGSGSGSVGIPSLGGENEVERISQPRNCPAFRATSSRRCAQGTLKPWDVPNKDGAQTGKVATAASSASCDQ